VSVFSSISISGSLIESYALSAPAAATAAAAAAAAAAFSFFLDIFLTKQWDFILTVCIEFFLAIFRLEALEIKENDKTQ